MKLRKRGGFAGLALFLSVCLGAALGSAAQTTEKAAKNPPNIVFFLADDLGWTDLGCMGSRYYGTPNIDRLARQGIKLTSAYTAGPNCAPTRAALMSGQYGPRTGVYTVGELTRGGGNRLKLTPPTNQQNLPVTKITIAQALKDAGYATAHFGKWHLGNGPQYHPGKRGFDEAIVSMGRHFDFQTNPPVAVKPGVYLADFLTEKALDFIERNKSRPFFVYLPHFGVHTPRQAKPEWVARFQDKKGANGHDDPTYAAMIASVDESVGKILDKLDALGLSENTLVIFSSDNGGVGGYQGEGLGARGITNNAPLRGGKGMLYEGGVRVPMLARWPGVIAPGGTSDTPIISVDLYPTLLEAAGTKGPAGYTLDGESFLPLLRSGGKETPQRDALYWHFPGYLESGTGWRTTPAGAIRAGDYKLIEFFEDGRRELYDLKADLSQKNDLAQRMPEKTRELHTKLVAWRAALNAPVPPPNPRFDPAAAPEPRRAGGRRAGRAAAP